MATEGTKFQVNFKTHKDGTLINLYADSIKELETQITDISMIAALIKSTESELYTSPQGASHSAPTVASVSEAFNATPVAAPSGNACRHGSMVFKEGTNAQGKGWKAWMCAAPKGAADKCDPIWVR